MSDRPDPTGTDADGTDADRPSLVERVRALEAAGALDLPPVGGGDTAGRWRALHELARHDVSEARIAEAHVDARQILAEAGRTPTAGRLWGVWASEHPAHRVTATRSDGRLVLAGSKGFCGGAGLVDDALVTATVAVTGELLLVAVPVENLPPAAIDRSGWATPALADTSTATVDLTGIEVGDDDVVGPDRWYLDRPRFWDGAIGPAACWAGAAAGLVDHAVAHPPRDPHGRAHLGGLVAAAWSMAAALDRAGREIDEAGDRPVPVDAHRRALVVRHLVDATCAEVVDRFGRALGPRPLVGDREVISRLAALDLYRRQCHAERDLANLGDTWADTP